MRIRRSSLEALALEVASQERQRCHELLHAHTSVATGVGFTEPAPEVEVVMEVGQEDPKLVGIDVIVAEVGHRFRQTPRSVEGAVHHLLRQCSGLQKLFQPFVNLGQRKHSVAIGIESGEETPALASVLLTPAAWKPVQ